MTDPAEIEALARAMCVELGEDQDVIIKAKYPNKGSWPLWTERRDFARLYLAARRAEAKAEPVADLASQVATGDADAHTQEVWFAGNQYMLDRLCAVLKVNPNQVAWDGSDGSMQEEADALIWRILEAAKGDEAEPVAGMTERCTTLPSITLDELVEGHALPVTVSVEAESEGFYTVEITRANARPLLTAKQVEAVIAAFAKDECGCSDCVVAALRLAGVAK